MYLTPPYNPEVYSAEGSLIMGDEQCDMKAHLSQGFQCKGLASAQVCEDIGLHVHLHLST